MCYFPYSVIDKVFEIFDENGLYHVDICDPKVRYQTVIISKYFSVLFH